MKTPEAPIDKIKKLLALAGSGSGATEHEAQQAVAMASALMTKYNVEQSALLDKPNTMLKRITLEGGGEQWHSWLATATGMLMTVKTVSHGDDGTYSIIGAPHNVEAAALMLQWLVNQVELLYKRDLPKGMTKKERANFRRTFKQACSARVFQRSQVIVATLLTSDDAAMQATGSTALIVRSTVQEQLDAIKEFMTAEGFETVKKKMSMGVGLGTALGAKAGTEVQLDRQVTARASSRLAITHRRS